MADLPLTRELIDALGRRCVGDLLPGEDQYLFVQARAALDLADEVKRLRAKVERYVERLQDYSGQCWVEIPDPDAPWEPWVCELNAGHDGPCDVPSRRTAEPDRG